LRRFSQRGSFLKKVLFANEFGVQFLFAGQHEFVFGGEEMFVAVKNRVANDGLV